jgi:DnaJ-class molecular chaperone
MSGADPVGKEGGVIIRFPDEEKCAKCGGTGLVWAASKRTRRPQVAAACEACHGSGRIRPAGAAKVLVKGGGR